MKLGGTNSQSFCGALWVCMEEFEVVVADMENVGIGRADAVRFDPARSRMDARDVQAAVDEIASDLDTIKRSFENMGGAGAGLFEVPDDDEGPGGAQPTGGPGHNPGPGFGLPAGGGGGGGGGGQAPPGGTPPGGPPPPG